MYLLSTYWNPILDLRIFLERFICGRWIISVESIRNRPEIEYGRSVSSRCLELVTLQVLATNPPLWMYSVLALLLVTVHMTQDQWDLPKSSTKAASDRWENSFKWHFHGLKLDVRILGCWFVREIFKEAL